MIKKQRPTNRPAVARIGMTAGLMVAVVAIAGVGGAMAGATGAQAQPGPSTTLTPVRVAITVAPVDPTSTAPPSSTPGSGNSTTNTPSANTPSANTPSATTPSANTASSGSRYSDPLADFANAALDALRSRGGATTAAGSVAPGNTSPPSTSGSVVSRPPVGNGDQTWSSAVIATDSLADYLLGTAVYVPMSAAATSALAVLPTDPASRYAATLHSVATIIAARLKVDAAPLEAAWVRADERRLRAVLTALAQTGTMYRYTGNQPGGFDCSGLTSYAWSQAGVKIPRTSGDQIAWAAPRTQDQLLPGDLVWHPGHVSMYLGVGDLIVNSPQTGKPVEVKRWGSSTSRWGSPL